MEIVTIYGKLLKDKITSSGAEYQLVRNSKAYDPIVGWFHVTKAGDKWKLLRMLRESRAEVYPDWVD